IRIPKECHRFIYRVKYGHINIAKFLIENKADIDIKDNEGQTPIFYAIIYKHYDIVKLLIENGADVQIRDNNKASVYDYADFNGKTQLSTYILYKSKH
ncbi:hypothetical protein PFHG_05133, partial [Plasmodium falciparum HB3]